MSDRGGTDREFDLSTDETDPEWGVVFDVDGVLVDTSDSYRRTIRETVERVHDATVDPEAVERFKEAGGFNDDWELTEALAAYVLARREGYERAVAEHTQAVADAGGGLDGSRAVLESALSGAAHGRVAEAVDPERLRRVFQRLYLGRDRYREMEGDPEPVEAEAGIDPDAGGYVDDERVLVSEATVKAVRAHPVGVFTGRPAAEAAIALERVGLDLPEERVVTMDDPYPGKPDPAGLLALGERLGSQAVLYLGDTVDDMRAARRANNSGERPTRVGETTDDRRFVGGGVQTGGLDGDRGKRLLRKEGAELIFSHVDGVTEFLPGDAETDAGAGGG